MSIRDDRRKVLQQIKFDQLAMEREVSADRDQSAHDTSDRTWHELKQSQDNTELARQFVWWMRQLGIDPDHGAWPTKGWIVGSVETVSTGPQESTYSTQHLLIVSTSGKIRCKAGKQLTNALAADKIRSKIRSIEQRFGIVCAFDYK